MLVKDLKYSYADVFVAPAVLSEISHRKECNPYINGKLPIFAAPMATVVNQKNYSIFNRNKINAVLPRNIDINIRLNFVKNKKWVAFSQKEFKELFVDSKFEHDKELFVCIDVANGHMASLYNDIKKAKNNYGDNIHIMTGNIANPLTYVEASKAGVEFIKISIGTGKACTTSTNCAIHYPIASLIDEIAQIKTKDPSNFGVDKWANIIADGGIRNYSDIIKSLALGADYVMIGGEFAKLYESASKIFAKTEDGDTINIDPTCINYETFLHEYGNIEIYKEFFGMASKYGQRSLGKDGTQTEEGKYMTFKCEKCLEQWTNEFTDYIKSAMSYTNSKNVTDLKNANVYLASNNAYNSINH